MENTSEKVSRSNQGGLPEALEVAATVNAPTPVLAGFNGVLGASSPAGDGQSRGGLVRPGDRFATKPGETETDRPPPLRGRACGCTGLLIITTSEGGTVRGSDY